MIVIQCKVDYLEKKRRLRVTLCLGVTNFIFGRLNRLMVYTHLETKQYSHSQLLSHSSNHKSQLLKDLMEHSHPTSHQQIQWF